MRPKVLKESGRQLEMLEKLSAEVHSLGIKQSELRHHQENRISRLSDRIEVCEERIGEFYESVHEKPSETDSDGLYKSATGASPEELCRFFNAIRKVTVTLDGTMKAELEVRFF